MKVLIGPQKEYEPSMDIASQIVYYCELELPKVIPTLTFSSSPSQYVGPCGRTSVARCLEYVNQASSVSLEPTG